jgi:hypothetical protein
MLIGKLARLEGTQLPRMSTHVALLHVERGIIHTINPLVAFHGPASWFYFLNIRLFVTRLFSYLFPQLFLTILAKVGGLSLSTHTSPRSLCIALSRCCQPHPDPSIGDLKLSKRTSTSQMPPVRRLRCLASLR